MNCLDFEVEKIEVKITMRPNMVKKDFGNFEAYICSDVKVKN